jgi:hypothetical protein
MINHVVVMKSNQESPKKLSGPETSLTNCQQDHGHQDVRVRPGHPAVVAFL